MEFCFCLGYFYNSCNFFINTYIEKKSERLRNEIRSEIQQLFEGRQDRGDGFVDFNDGIFDVDFNNGKVKNYKRAQIPPKPQKSEWDGLGGGDPDNNYRKRLNEWRSQWGDVSSVWNLNWGSSKIENREDEGWNLVRIYCGGLDEEFIEISFIFPYQIAFRKTKGSNPFSIQDAVRESYNFYTTNPDNGFLEGSGRAIMNKIHNAANEYFRITKNKDKISHYVGSSIPDGEDYTKGGPIHIDAIFNDCFIVNIATSQSRYYKIDKYPWNPDIQERNKLYIFWLCGIFLICWIPIIILIIKNRKESKQQRETLKEKLLRICSPSNLMNNYDKEKIAAANFLYQEIMNCDDDSTLIQLADKAQTELSVNLISKEDLNEQKKKLTQKSL